MGIIIYTTKTCSFCKRAKEFLREHDISFEEKDAGNPANAKKAIEISGQMGVPVIDIDGKIIVGFDEAKIKEALNLLD